MWMISPLKEVVKLGAIIRINPMMTQIPIPMRAFEAFSRAPGKSSAIFGQKFRNINAHHTGVCVLLMVLR